MPGAAKGAVIGALLGALSGDCVGAPSEGSRGVPVPVARRRVRRALARRTLRYTDDTQLTLALIDHLVLDDDRVDADLLARRMLARYDDRRGYGAGMRRLVGLWRDGLPVGDAATAVFPDGSFGNGAAMRVAPVGLRWAGQPDLLTAVAERSARVTHAHPVGIDGAVVQAHAVAVAATTGRFGIDDLAALPAGTDELRDGLAAAVRLPDGASAGTAASTLGTSPIAQRSLPAALWCAATCENIEETVTLAIAMGGDTDTVAAMAGAVRGAALGADAIPDSWHRALEGFDEVLDAAVRLHARAADDDAGS